jgi:CIC family chloride channel protein
MSSFDAIKVQFYKLTKDFGFLISSQSHFLKWLILGAIVGIIAGFGALVFYYSIKLAEWFFCIIYWAVYYLCQKVRA